MCSLREGFPCNSDKDVKKEWLHQLAWEVVNFCKTPFPKEDVEVVRKILQDPLRSRQERLPGEEDHFGYCICGEGNILIQDSLLEPRYTSN